MKRNLISTTFYASLVSVSLALVGCFMLGCFLYIVMIIKMGALYNPKSTIVFVFTWLFPILETQLFGLAFLSIGRYGQRAAGILSLLYTGITFAVIYGYYYVRLYTGTWHNPYAVAGILAVSLVLSYIMYFNRLKDIAQEYSVENEELMKPIYSGLYEQGFYRFMSPNDFGRVYDQTVRQKEVFLDIKQLSHEMHTDYDVIDPEPDASRRQYFVDFRRLYEAEAGTAVNEIVKIAESLSLPIDRYARGKITDELSSAKASITGSRYARFDAYAASFAKLINEKILAASGDKIYLRGGGNDGQFIFLTEGMYSMIAKIDKWCLRRA